ncbi:MAG: hypothetical protein U9P63_02000 [Patescibacteria group bacterium]|nr:hypothetical protein [Patescibacteria group bacterium]
MFKIIPDNIQGYAKFFVQRSGTKNLGEYWALAKREPHTLCYVM